MRLKVRADRRPGQQCRHYPPRRRRRLLRAGLGRRAGPEPEGRLPAQPGIRRRLMAEGGRPHRQHRLAAVLPGRYRVASTRPRTRHRWRHPHPGKRMGGQERQPQRHRTGLHHLQQHRSAAQGPDRSPAILRAFPRPLGVPADIGDAVVFLLAPPPTICTARRSRSMAAGWRGKASRIVDCGTVTDSYPIVLGFPSKGSGEFFWQGFNAGLSGGSRRSFEQFLRCSTQRPDPVT